MGAPAIPRVGYQSGGEQQNPFAIRGQELQFPREQCVPELIARRAACAPNSTAVVDTGTRLTFSELMSRSNQLANVLRALGVQREVKVALCLNRSAEAIVAALAVLKAGGGYLPLDPNYPAQRLSYILCDAGVRLVLSERALAELLPAGNWRIVIAEEVNSSIERYSTEPPPHAPRPEHLAYTIYTSGSTGTPKGVEVTHGSLLNLIYWHQAAFAVTSQDRATQIASYGFDAAVWEVWPHLTAGASVFVAPDVGRTSPDALRDWLVAHQITISFVPTALAELLLDMEWPSDCKLRFLLTGADTLHRYARAGLPFQLINNYGPTECTVVATSAPVPVGLDGERRPAIGRPIANTAVYILDEQRTPVVPGDVGEMYIGGAGVARGYVNSSELTARKFIDNAFPDALSPRLYRTGDRARLLPDGQIEFLGRVDDLIKIRGYRVEPNEIVTVLDSHPAIQASTVMAVEGRSSNLRLVAWIVFKPGASATAQELRSFVGSKLPDYMVPALFVPLGALPLNPNGKIDKDALPAADEASALQDQSYVAPRNLLEEKLSGIIAQLLGMDRVGVEENFFLLGGHSLLGTQLIARVRDVFGVELSLRSIFDYPTAVQMAQEVERLIVLQLNAMTDDEAQRALAQAESAGGEK